MADGNEYRLRIDAFSVESIPMSRLAEYMAELARLLGEQERVHFVKLDPGSAVLVSRVEGPAVPRVRDRLRRLQESQASRDVMQAFYALDVMLAKDGATATLIPSDGAEVIEFPGRNRPKPMRYGPFRESGSLDGKIIRVGGKGDPVPIHLQSKSKSRDITYPCYSSIDLSIELAKFYRKFTVRVHGTGKWNREDDRSWNLERFDIDQFEILDDAPLNKIINRLHTVEGGLWNEDGFGPNDILGLRRDPGDQH